MFNFISNSKYYIGDIKTHEAKTIFLTQRKKVKTKIVSISLVIKKKTIAKKHTSLQMMISSSFCSLLRVSNKSKPPVERSGSVPPKKGKINKFSLCLGGVVLLCRNNLHPSAYVAVGC